MIKTLSSHLGVAVVLGRKWCVGFDGTRDEEDYTARVVRYSFGGPDARDATMRFVMMDLIAIEGKK